MTANGVKSVFMRGFSVPIAIGKECRSDYKQLVLGKEILIQLIIK